MIFIGYKKCSTCKRISKQMDEKNISYKYREIDKENPSREELESWYQKSGLDIKKFFNTSGKVYRENNLKDKLKTMDLDEKLDLLSKDGMLVKRPILLDGDKIFVGNQVEKYIESYDIYGNRTILSNINPGHIFAETYAILKNEPMLVSVVANEDSKVLMLNITNLQHIIKAKEDWSTKLLMNLLKISSNKNLILSNKIFTNSPKTIREKVLVYLNFISLKKNSNEFNIPFNRKQLADYLNIDRSCLSNELGKMQKEGLITTKKSHFIIHKKATK